VARASCPAGQRSSLTAPDESVTGRFSAAATSFTQLPVAQLPWGHVTVLLDKLDKLDKLGDQRERDWYAAAAVEYGWSRNVLLNQIMSQLQPRAGTAPSNFTAQLPAADSELAQQLTRDSYVLAFLDLTGPVAERDLEKALVDRLHDLLLEAYQDERDHGLSAAVLGAWVRNRRHDRPWGWVIKALQALGRRLYVNASLPCPVERVCHADRRNGNSDPRS